MGFLHVLDEYRHRGYARSLWWNAQFTTNAFPTGSDSRKLRTTSGSSTRTGFVAGAIGACGKRLPRGSLNSLHDERFLRAVHAERVEDEVVEERGDRDLGPALLVLERRADEGGREGGPGPLEGRVLGG